MQNPDRLANIKRLYNEARILAFYYQYAIWYNQKIDEARKEETKEKTKEDVFVKKLLMKKKFHGKDVVVS